MCFIRCLMFSVIIYFVASETYIDEDFFYRDVNLTLNGSPYIFLKGVIKTTKRVQFFPGVEFMLCSQCELYLQGETIISGNSSHKITFTSLRKLSTKLDSLYGLIQLDGEDEIVVTDCIVENGYRFVMNKTTTLLRVELRNMQCGFKNNNGTMPISAMKEVFFKNCVISSSCGVICVNFDKKDEKRVIHVDRCRFENMTIGIFLGWYCSVDINNSVFTNNTVGVRYGVLEGVTPFESYVIIRNSKFLYSKYEAISLSRTYRVQILDNVFESNKGDVINFCNWVSKEFVVARNVFRKNYMGGEQGDAFVLCRLPEHQTPYDSVVNMARIDTYPQTLLMRVVSNNFVDNDYKYIAQCGRLTDSTCIKDVKADFSHNFWGTGLSATEISSGFRCPNVCPFEPYLTLPYDDCSVCKEGCGECKFLDVYDYGLYCECYDGYFGKFCEVSTCGGILSNDSSVCSNNGDCVKKDVCLCDDKHNGKDCKNKKASDGGEDKKSKELTIIISTAFVGLLLFALCFCLVACICLIGFCGVCIETGICVWCVGKKGKEQLERRRLLGDSENKDFVFERSLTGCKLKDFEFVYGENGKIKALGGKAFGGEGVCGVIFQARVKNPEFSERNLVIKVIINVHCEESTSIKKEFVEKEFDYGVRRHPNLCRIHHWFIEEIDKQHMEDFGWNEKFEEDIVLKKTTFFVMPLYKCSLSDVMKQYKEKCQKMPETEFLKLVRDVCRGILVLQEKDIVHRDVKPANIFFDEENDVFVVGDFGCCSVFKDLKYKYEGLEPRGGSPYFHPPEVSTLVNGRLYYFNKWDLFALGLTCYKIYSDESPFKERIQQGKDKTEMREDRYYRELEEEECSEFVRNLISNMLKCDYEKRYSPERVVDVVLEKMNEDIIDEENGGYEEVEESLNSEHETLYGIQ